MFLSELVDWKELEDDLSVYFSQSSGAPAKPIRLIAGLLVLQQFYGLSDEHIVSRWVENPYWQYFCGYDYLQWKMPIDPTTLVNWRKRLGKEGMQKVLNATVKWALDIGLTSQVSLTNVIVDTTVMPKNICYPTDAKLYYSGLKSLLRIAKRFQIPLRQSYTFLSRNALRNTQKYAHARQMKRASRESKRLHTYLGRVRRDIERNSSERPDLLAILRPVLGTIDRLLQQQRQDSKKIYSLHETDVDCISKGKAHKKYEFGCKTSIVVTHKEGLALSVQALHGNPYDGHTLAEALKEAEEISQTKIKRVFVDKGYRGHNVKDKEVYITGMRGLSQHFKKLLRRRSAIEPVIGHMKSDGKLGKNYLKGKLGDCLNAILCGIGHNVRLIVNYLKGQNQPKFA
jgi:IS5 family transposase